MTSTTTAPLLPAPPDLLAFLRACARDHLDRQGTNGPSRLHVVHSRRAGRGVTLGRKAALLRRVAAGPERPADVLLRHARAVAPGGLGHRAAVASGVDLSPRTWCGAVLVCPTWVVRSRVGSVEEVAATELAHRRRLHEDPNREDSVVVQYTGVDGTTGFGTLFAADGEWRVVVGRPDGTTVPDPGVRVPQGDVPDAVAAVVDAYRAVQLARAGAAAAGGGRP